MNNISITTWISVAALLFSIIATLNTLWSNSRQNKVNKTQEEINNRLLEKDNEERITALQASLDANFTMIGKNYLLKVFNKGNCSARNVIISLPTGDDVISQSEINEKFPLAKLEPHNGVDVHTFVYLGSLRRHEITIKWDDDYETGRVVILTRDLY